MEFVFPIESKEEFIYILKSHCRRIEKPISFEPIALSFNRKIRDKTIYGNINDSSFWLRAYNAKGYEARLPGRYCFGRLKENGDELLVKISWRFTLYWPVTLILIYLIFLIEAKFSMPALFISLPLYIVVCLVIFVIGFGMHEKEEQQVIELLEMIYTDICQKYGSMRSE